MSEFFDLRKFGIFAEVDGIVLLKRGYNEFPKFFLPRKVIFDHEDLVLKNGDIINDELANNNKVLHHGSEDVAGDFWYGPGIFLANGDYSVNFEMKVASNSCEGNITIALFDGQLLCHTKWLDLNQCGLSQK